jgi:hypothetical protein
VKRRRIGLAAALLAAAAVGSVTTFTVGGISASVASPTPAAVSSATVERTDLVSTVLTEGTLGYAPTNPVVNRLQGTYTQLPVGGATLAAGQVLYRVDDAPVVLMLGSTPAWRSFAAGMSDGPDVGELESNLISLGDASGLFSVASDHFGALTADAVKRWEAATGLTTDAQIPFGEVVFLPSPVLVGALSVSPGQPASPGDAPFGVTTTTRDVSVPLGPNLPPAAVGEAVSIVLATGTTTPGRISAVGPAPPSGAASQGSSGSGGSGTGGGPGPSQASSIATVTPNDPQATGTADGVAVEVSLTTQAANDVLAVPISALLALAGGGYGLEEIEPSGARRLVGVTTGVFTGSEVQVSGGGLRAGTRVVVAQ